MLHGSPVHQIDASRGPKEIGVGPSDNCDRLAGVVRLPGRSPVQPLSAMDIHEPAMQRCGTPFPALFSGVATVRLNPS